jgi:Threonyl-tRNA synthetase
VEKIPFVVVWGDKESDDALAIREHGGSQETLSLADFRSKACYPCSLASRGGTVSHLLAQRYGGSTDPKVERNRCRCMPAVFSFQQSTKEDKTSLVTGH